MKIQNVVPALHNVITQNNIVLYIFFLSHILENLRFYEGMTDENGHQL